LKAIGFYSSGFALHLQILGAPLLDRYLPPLLGGVAVGLWSSGLLGGGHRVMGFSSRPRPRIFPGRHRAARGVPLLLAGHRHRCLSRRHHSASERGIAAAAAAFGYRTASILASTVLVLIAHTPLARGFSGHRP